MRRPEPHLQQHQEDLAFRLTPLSADLEHNVSTETIWYTDALASKSSRNERTNYIVLAEIPKSATSQDVLRALKQNNIVKKDFPVSNRKYIEKYVLIFSHYAPTILPTRSYADEKRPPHVRRCRLRASTSCYQSCHRKTIIPRNFIVGPRTSTSIESRYETKSTRLSKSIYRVQVGRWSTT